MRTLKQLRESCEVVEAVSVGMTEGRGRGLFAARAMKAGDTVLIERPLVGMQSLDNARDVTVCRNCLGFAGDVISQLEVLSGVPRHECLKRHRRRTRNLACGNKKAEQRPGRLSGLCECLEGCGEVYCSAACRSEHWDRSHRLLCVGPIPEEGAEDHPLVAFRVHAVRTNEIFLLVGEVLAQIAAAFSEDPPTCAGDTSDTVDAEDNLAAARAPFADFVQEPWWDVAVPRDGTDPEDAVDTAAATSLPDTLRALCEESSALLRRAFALALGPLPAPLELALGAESFARVVGMFEQNNVGVRAPSPIPGVLRELLAEGEVEGDAVVDGHAHRGAARRKVLQEAAPLVFEILGEENACEDGEGDGDEDEGAGEIAWKCCGGEGGGEGGDGDQHGGCCGSTEGGERVAEAAGKTGSAAAAASGGCADEDVDEDEDEVVSKRCGGQQEGSKGDDVGHGCCASTANGSGVGFDEKDVEAAGRTDSTAAAATAAARWRGESADSDEDNIVAVLRSAVDDDGGDEDEPGEDLFAPLDGTALYSLVCCMNHSCRPNCVVRYPGVRQQQQHQGGKESGGRDAGGAADPLVAEVMLLEDVPAGKELTQSYVTREMELAERRQALEDYGFLCACPRCLEEEE